MARLGPPVDYNPFEKKKATGSSKPSGRLGEPVDFNPFEPKPQMGKYVHGNLPMSKRAQNFAAVAPYKAQMQSPEVLPYDPTYPNDYTDQNASYGTKLATDAFQSIANIIDTVPGMYRQSQAMTKLGKALSEYDATGRVQLTPEVRAPQPQAGFGLGPSLSVGDQRLVTPATYAEGQDALDYIKSIRRELSSEDANRSEAFRQVEGPIAEAFASTAAQPEQALSAAGSVIGAGLGTAVAGPGAGTAVGAKVGAAIGMTPALQTAYYQTYAEGRDQGLSPEDSDRRAKISLGIEAATEMIPGLGGVAKSGFGTVVRQSVTNAMDEGVAQTANIASDLLSATLTNDPEARKVYQQLAPKSFGEGVKQVAESALGGLVGGAVLTAPSAALQGASAMRNRLTPSLDKKTTNDKKTSPVTEPLKVNPINGSLTVQSTPVVDTSVTAPSSTAPSDSVVSDTVIPITDKSFSRAAGTNSLQQESQVVNTQGPLVTPVDTPKSEDSPSDSPYARIREMERAITGDPMRFVDGIRKNRSAVESLLDSLVQERADAEREIRRKYGVKSTDELDESSMSRDEANFMFYDDSPDSSYLDRVAPYMEDRRDVEYELSRLARELPDTPDGISASKEQLARAKYIVLEATDMGLDGDAILKSVAERVAERYNDTNDAAQMAKSYLVTLRDLLFRPETSSSEEAASQSSVPARAQNLLEVVPATTPQAPAANVAPEPVQSAVASFKTEKGSTYQVNGRSTTRNKSDHTQQGHDATDVGEKEPSLVTVYFDRSAAKASLSAAGVQNVSKSRVVLDENNKRAYLFTWNEAAGKWGLTAGMRDGVPYETEPRVGLSPLEVWKETSPEDSPIGAIEQDKRSGLRSFSGMHEGNKIVEVTAPKAKAPKKPKAIRNRISTPEQIATEELQQRVKTDPEYRARIEANRTLFLSDIQNRAAEIAAQQATQPTTQEVTTNNGEVLQKEEGQRQQQQGQGPEVTPPAQLATGTPTGKSTYASEQELKDDLFSGWMDPLASNAQKMDAEGRLVVYNGLSDLDTKDPQAAAGVRKALSVVSGGRQGASASAFAYNGKVYLDVSGVEKGQAKSKFLHEAMVHVEAKAGTDGRTRVNSLAARVDAWANAGDPTARAAIDHVNTHYAGLINKVNAGDTKSALTVQEEKLAKYVQMLYDKYGGDAKGMIGTAKRLYNDIVSYFREKISRGLKALGFEGLQIRDRDILDAVRYGRDVTAFKDKTYTPGQATGATPSTTSSANMASPDMDAQLSVDDDTNSGEKSVLDVRESSLYKAMGNAGIRALVAQGTASSDVFRVAIEERAGFQRLYVFKAEMLAKEVEDIISRLAKAMPDRAATRDKYRSLAAQYFMGDKTVNIPQDLKNVTDEFRNIVTDLQVLGIAYGVWSPKSVPRIMKSFGKWSRRAFQVFDLNPGEWKAIQMGLAARGKKDVVTQELPNIMKSMKLPSADKIRAMGVAARRKIPTDITKKEADKRRKERDAVRAKMRRYAESWGITSKKFRDIENQLIQLEAMGPDKLREKAIEWGTRLLDPRSSATFSPMIGPKNTLLIDDSSVDKARKQVPEWLQRLWGRHERIDSQALISIEHLATIVAKYRAMTDLLSAGLADGSIIAPGDVTRSKRGYKEIDSDNPHDYGPLQGHWIKEEDAWLLEQSMYESALAYVLRQGNLEQHTAVLQQKYPNSTAANMALATATLLGPIGRVFKQLQVNVSLSALFINTASAFTLLAPTLGSWTAVKAIPQSVKIARSSAFAGIPLLQSKVTDAQLSKDLDYLMTKGLLQDGALAAQSRKQAIEKIREESNALRSGFAKTKNWSVNAFTSVFDVLSRMNSFGDETAKLLTFYARRAWNQQVFGVSESEAADMAVEEVKDTMPSYTRTSPIAKALSNLGVIGAFIGWHAEMIRTTVNLARTAGSKITKGIKDGNIGLVKYGMFDLSQIGLRTMAVTLLDATVAAPVFALVSMLGADDEEEKQIEAGQKINSDPTLSRAMYELLPGWNKSNVHVSRDLGDGTYVTYTTRRYEMMPWGQMISAVAKGDNETAMETLKDTYASIYPTAIAAPGLGVAMLKWFKADGVKDSAAAWDEVEKYSRDLAKSLTAGSVRTGAKILSGDEKTGVKFTEGELAMEVAGFSPTVVDLGNIISQHVFQYTGAMDDEKRRLSKDTYSEDGAIDLFSNASLKYDLWKEARRKVEALKAMGYDYDYFNSALDRNPATANVSKKERKGLWEGYFILPDYTEFLNDRQDTEIERNPAKESEITAKYDEYRKRLEEDWPKIESMLNEQNVNYYED